MFEDRRQFPRASVELEVEYDRLNSFLYDWARNISQGGTFVETDEPLEVGTEAMFMLNAPGFSEPLAIRGRVVWSSRDGGPPPVGAAAGAQGMGVRFLYDSDEHRRSIEETVGRLIRDQLGDLAYTKLMGRTAPR